MLTHSMVLNYKSVTIAEMPFREFASEHEEKPRYIRMLRAIMSAGKNSKLFTTITYYRFNARPTYGNDWRCRQYQNSVAFRAILIYESELCDGENPII